MQNIVDYIIVGAGSAGCVLAYRLLEGGKKNILLLEAGGSDNSIYIKMPTALSIPMNSPKYDWGYYTEPEPYMNNRRLHCPRGRVLGGSSSINGMAYVRGHPMDYETWVKEGAEGWSYSENLPYFKRAEKYHDRGSLLSKHWYWRGKNGPLHVTRGKLYNPLHRALLKAGEEAGYGYTEDMNGYKQEGMAVMDRTTYAGIRMSTAQTYLRKAKKNPSAKKNLSILTHCHVTKILFDENKRAYGVVYTRGNQEHVVRAKHEIIIASGAINSPYLLQLSGVGDPTILHKHNIKIIHSLRHVGRNLMDHLETYIQYRCKKPISLNRHLSFFSKALIGIKWFLFKSGLGITNHFECGAFIRSRRAIQWPDIQYHFLPAAMRYDGKSALRGDGFQLHTGPMRSKSRGRVGLQYKNGHIHPHILFNYMSHEEDFLDFRRAIQLSREIINQKAFDEFRAEEISPGIHCHNDADLDNFIKDKSESAYHPCGTCRMGQSASNSVVDTQCRIHGLKNIRVIDASVMPHITNGNLNAPTIMIAEKVADMILGHPPLEPMTEPWYIPPQWQTQQRIYQPHNISYNI